MFIKSVRIVGDVPPWAADAPAIQALAAAGGFQFRAPITVLTGGNGVGKSTLLEAIARAWGFPLTGGTYGVRKAGPLDPLYGSVELELGGRHKAGYFLRSETHNFVAQDYGEFLGRSHGESILDLAFRFLPDSLYILDEPEAGLSPISQMALLAQLHALAEAGAQIIMATHSPILLAIPGADIVEVTGPTSECRRGLRVEETIAFRALRDFLDDPAGIAEYMADWAEDNYPD